MLCNIFKSGLYFKVIRTKVSGKRAQWAEQARCASVAWRENPTRNRIQKSNETKTFEN